jgi:uroporphyrinogen decarboxylase
MTSKERVLAAFGHQEPDRVPINYSANGGIDARLKAHYGLQPGDTVGLCNLLGVDFRYVGAPYTGPRLHPELPDRHVSPEWGIRTRWIEHESGGYWDFCDFPLSEADEETVANWPMPSPDDYNYDAVVAACEANREYACHIGHPGLPDIINSTGMVRGMEQVLVDLVTDDPAGMLLIDRKTRVLLEVTERVLDKAGHLIDFMWMGEDLGTQNSQILSLDLFRRQIRPRHQWFIDLAKAYDLPVMIHSCGSSSWAFHDFIEMGINVVDTLQPEAKDMAPAYLKQTYGRDLAFHGCISTAGPVAYGSVDDVEKDCREILETMMPGGGYCFAPTHALQDNSPTENVVRMYECAHRFGVY